MYVEGNPKTKSALKAMVKEGSFPRIFSPGMFPPAPSGTETVEGPHYPEPHKWYARVQVEDGKIVKVLS